jgi:lysophospholipase L1-like esterase
MNRFCLCFLFALVLSSPAFAGGTVQWPFPNPPPGTNSAIFASPRLEWFSKFAGNLENSRKMGAINLIFEGDSITDSWQTKGRGQEVWDQHYAKLQAFDFGISGDRTENVLWRLQNGQVDGLHPKMVALMIGTNNANNSPEQIAEGIKAIVGEYQKRCPGVVVLLQGVFPRGALATDPARAKIKAINQIISQMGDGKTVIYVDFGDKFLEPDGSISKDIMPDFLHPSAKGYQIWADAIQPVIDKYFPVAAQ